MVPAALGTSGVFDPWTAGRGPASLSGSIRPIILAGLSRCGFRGGPGICAGEREAARQVPHWAFTKARASPSPANKYDPGRSAMQSSGVDTGPDVAPLPAMLPVAR